MTRGKRLYWLAAPAAIVVLAVAGITVGTRMTSADDVSGDPANAGKLDDGKDLLPQTKITVEQAIVAAQTAASGNIGEIDLEDYQGKLAFNVDVGDRDVKVDAENGTVLGVGSD